MYAIFYHVPGQGWLCDYPQTLREAAESLRWLRSQYREVEFKTYK